MFQPYQAPTSPPPGFYDPALDSQERAAQRGYVDLQQDTDTGQQRDQSGLISTSGRLNEDYATSTGRLNEDFNTSLASLLRNRQRGQEDYTTATGDVKRNYQQLGDRQTQTAVNQGVTGGGALQAGADVRKENQGREQGRMDTSYQRSVQDSAFQEQGLRTSLQRALADAQQSFSRGTEDLGTQYQQGTDDRATALGRAGRELGFYGQDIGAQRFFQAGQSGWAPPGRGEPGGQPANEFRDAQGNPFRVVVQGNYRLRVRPDGTIISRERR
jgi:hypothetical protein